MTSTSGADRDVGFNRLLAKLQLYGPPIRDMDLRVGQLIVNAMVWGQQGQDPYYIEDAELADLIEKYMLQHRPPINMSWVEG